MRVIRGSEARSATAAIAAAVDACRGITVYSITIAIPKMMKAVAAPETGAVEPARDRGEIRRRRGLWSRIVVDDNDLFDLARELVKLVLFVKLDLARCAALDAVQQSSFPFPRAAAQLQRCHGRHRR